MRKMSRLTVMVGVLVVLVLMVAFAPPAHAQTITLTGRPLFDVNIRSAPGTNRSIIDVLPYFEEVEVIGRNEGNNWVQINYEETTGWVAAWLLIFSDDTSRLPVTTDVEPPLASGPGPFDLIVPFALNLRAQPSLTAQVLEVIEYNTTLSAIGRDARSSWVEVRHQGRVGWVAAWMTVTRGDINALPVVAGTTTTSPAPAPTVVSAPNPAPGITVEAIYDLNLRQAPTLNAGIVTVAPFGSTLRAIGRNAGNNWVQVRYGNVTGWVAAWIAPISDNPLSLPITSQSTEFARTWDPAITAHALINMTIRSLPEVNYAPLGTVTAGTEVELLSRTEDSMWVKITHQNTTGWIVTWPLIATADLNNLPVENPFP